MSDPLNLYLNGWKAHELLSLSLSKDVIIKVGLGLSSVGQRQVETFPEVISVSWLHMLLNV